jgi:asparagine synthase (glutamine-hydrolysing)
MSVQFGQWNFGGKHVDTDYLEKVVPAIARYGPDGHASYVSSGVAVHYAAFHTTKESRLEMQPHISPSGTVVTWDGRLDNRTELLSDLRDAPGVGSTDVEIVAAAYDRWGTRSLSRLIGDWALALWSSKNRTLILAKDFLGSRHLYYRLSQDRIAWSTILDPLVLPSGETFTLCEEYIAGWLSFGPAAHLTPYGEIRSVPPSSFVLVTAGKCLIEQYWNFDPARIRYRGDREYEEHFRAVFGQAVKRRLRSDSAVLAELSGGIDSSSIVSMADTIVTRTPAEFPRVDTISYYNDSEPNWNERPYFAKVEEGRGRIGCHIDVGSQELFALGESGDRFALIPGSCGRPLKTGLQLQACMASQGNRVLLSGIGGDEVTGGVPTSTPELEDLLALAQFRKCAHQLRVWALDKRKPWPHLLLEAIERFLPRFLVAVPIHRRPPVWVDKAFVKRNRAAIEGYERRSTLLGPLPSFQENLGTLDRLRRHVASTAPTLTPLCERRYPYLDRDLLAFLYAIPREQLVRPGQRRSLMRRALAGIVPEELLNRKRKAFVSRSPIKRIVTQRADIASASDLLRDASLGIVDSMALRQAIDRFRHGEEISTSAVARALELQLWLAAVKSRGILSSE